MKKKMIALLTAFTFAFAAFSFATSNVAQAKGYSSGKSSYSPSQNQATTPNKSQSSNVQQSSTKPASTSAASSNKGGLMKGLLLGGIGGLLMGSLFAGLGPIGSGLSLIINLLLFAGVIMLLVSAFKAFKNRRKDQEAWKR